MYEAQLEKDWRYIVNDSDAKLIIAASENIYKVVEEYIGKVRLYFDTNIGRIGISFMWLCTDIGQIKFILHGHWTLSVESGLNML